jgi:beta-galactosidase
MERNEGGIGRREALRSAAAMLALGGTLPGQVTALQTAAVEVRRNQSFDEGWRFLRGDAAGAEAPGFDDGRWRVVDLPHDWSVEELPPRPGEGNGEGAIWGTAVLPTRIGPFDTELSQGGRDTGWFVGGTGWYRKRFSAAGVPAWGQVEIVFDGVYMNSEVWLNGTLLGNLHIVRV